MFIHTTIAINPTINGIASDAPTLEAEIYPCYQATFFEGKPTQSPLSRRPFDEPAGIEAIG